jgi:hypothetical protein
VAAVLAMTLASISQGGQTDIAATPIASTTAALVKPNIMLLMDASGSMARTHMPDEVETMMGPTSVGYKSSQCNTLYYDPAQRYPRPKMYDGSLFPLQLFGAARYAGFGNYHAVPDLRITNLNSEFVAYDASTLEVPSPFPDTPQAAYYYVYTGPETLSFATAPCTQVDTGTTNVTPGGGTWTKVNVAAQPAVDKENFAIWYSYYRTRIALIKSAASLAFSPLNDTKRIGFITMQPKSSVGAAGINPLRFLPVGDFNPGPGGQKDKWFAKLFEQIPAGASPAREGLARVGRYYGGKEDSINTDMPATGANDPIQYTCQQNFAIMTTDGYWNGQTESRGPGLFGGGLQLDGSHQGRPAGRRSQRPVLAAADLGRHLQLHPRRHRQDQRLHRQRLQPVGHVPLDVPAPARSVDDDQGLHADDEAHDPVLPGAEPGLCADRPDDFHQHLGHAHDGAVRLAPGALHRREVPARQVAGADHQGHRAVGAADEPGRGADLPDAQDRHPGMEDRGAVADVQVAIRADDDPVRPAGRPVQARPQAGLPPPVPDARQDRR